jgi:hypothetical protein
MYKLIANNPAIPWRLRNGMEQWVESSCRERRPALYRWLHFGEAGERLRAVTAGPGHHFFGYYDKSPWNASGSLLLAHEAPFNDRAPCAADAVKVGVVRLDRGNAFQPLGQSHAWNWQQGAMLQWHPADPEQVFLHNDRRDGRFVGMVSDTDGRQLNMYDRPIYAVMPDGRSGFSLNFARLAAHRPGYGYAGVHDTFEDDATPREDGIWRMDLSSGQAELIVSMADLAGRDPRPSMDGAWHYVNHIQPSRGGKRIAFFHIWHRDEKSWEVRLYTCRPDGTELTCLLDTGSISHYDWRDDDSILIWAKRPDAPARFLFLSHPMNTPVGAASAANRPVSLAAEAALITSTGDAETRYRVFGEDALKEDGHCGFSPDGRWVLNDTYPDRHDMRTLMLVRWPQGERIDLARLHSPKSKWWGELRCDLHPRWSRDGTRVCVDSVHEGTRQMYVMDVSRWVR